MTGNDTAISLVDDAVPHPSSSSLHTQNLIDRARLLLQSLCDTRWPELEDEELIAVLDDCMNDSQKAKRLPLRNVAASLPSSWSVTLDWRISRSDQENLLRAIVVAGISTGQSITAGTKDGVKSTAPYQAVLVERRAALDGTNFRSR